jgi:AcrR family transcriptional regulator
MRVNLQARAAAAEQRRARTRERLLLAAEAVIAERGVGGASIADFARAAGVSRGAFYNYFPTITDLIDALNRRVARQVSQLLADIAQRPVEPATRLAASLHAVLAAYRADPVRGWLALQLVNSPAPPQRAYEIAFAALYEEGVKSGQFHDVDLVAAQTLCFGALRMSLRDALAGVPSVQTEELVAMVLSAYGVPHALAREISRNEAAAAVSPLVRAPA